MGLTAFLATGLGATLVAGLAGVLAFMGFEAVVTFFGAAALALTTAAFLATAVLATGLAPALGLAGWAFLVTTVLLWLAALADLVMD